MCGIADFFSGTSGKSGDARTDRDNHPWCLDKLGYRFEVFKGYIV